MITKEQARTEVLRYLQKREIHKPYNLVILDEHTREEDFGWVFFYNSKEYIETGDSKWALGGNAPIVVDRITGQLHLTGTARPINDYIEAYRRDGHF